MRVNPLHIVGIYLTVSVYIALGKVGKLIFTANMRINSLHIVGIGMNESFAQQREKWCESPQSCIDTMRACGGLAILAHPHWSLNTLDTMRSLKNVTAAEIYNTVSSGLRRPSLRVVWQCVFPR